MRLLVATPYERDQQSIARVLHEAGLDEELVWAADGPDMLKHLESGSFDLIYFDLPGDDLFAQIVNRNLNIPLIFVAERGNELQARASPVSSSN